MSKQPVIIDTFIVPVCYDDIDIIYQDEHILLINKPTKLLSLSGKNPLNKDSVHYRIVRDFPTATLLHRLDLGTSGLMLLALNKAVNATLTKQFQARKIEKSYTAILSGHLSKATGSITHPIAKDPPNFPRMKVCTESGKTAHTEFHLLSYVDKPKSSRVLFTPVTGRTHQLRLHAQQIGHPILGCDLYGSERTLKAATRLMLHATSLNFDHPITNDRMFGLSSCSF